MKDIDTEIKELQNKIERLKREKDAKDSLNFAERLAIVIHDVYDSHQHDDPWDYCMTEDNVPDFDKMPALGYISLARTQLDMLSDNFTPAQAFIILKAIHESKRTLRIY